MGVATELLTMAGSKCDVNFEYTPALVGGAAIDATGKPLPEETLETCK